MIGNRPSALPTAELRARLEARSCPEAITGCTLWHGYGNNHGYGQLGLTGFGLAKAVYAHRLAWELENGPIPAGLVIRHRCDTPQRINPGHMLIGTKHQNSLDAASRKRMRHGDRHPCAKLTVEQVQAIRDGHIGESQSTIARRYGVSPSHVGCIRSRKVRRHTP